MDDRASSVGLLRPMTAADAPAAAALHLRAFPSFFLSFLGAAFLRLLYRTLATNANAVALVWEEDGCLRGLIAGVQRQQGFYRHLLRRHWLSFAWASLGAALRRPAIIPRLWRALRRPAQAAESAADACLMSIAVEPSCSGKGVGRQLVQTFCQALALRGAPAVCLTTDQVDNERVNRFYVSLGFRLARVFVTPEGRAMNEYVLSLQ